jgi:hypothetical protein
MGWSAPLSKRHHLDDADLAAQGDGQDVPLAQHVAGLDDAHAVHPYLAAANQFGCRCPRFHQPRKPQPLIEPLLRCVPRFRHRQPGRSLWGQG